MRPSIRSKHEISNLSCSLPQETVSRTTISHLVAMCEEGDADLDWLTDCLSFPPQKKTKS